MEAKKQVSCKLSTPTQNLALECKSLHMLITSSPSWFFQHSYSLPVGGIPYLLNASFPPALITLSLAGLPCLGTRLPIHQDSPANSLLYLRWDTILRSNISYPAFPAVPETKGHFSFPWSFVILRERSKGSSMENAEYASCWLKAAAGNLQVPWWGVWPWQQPVWEQPSKTSRSTGHTDSYQWSLYFCHLKTWPNSCPLPEAFFRTTLSFHVITMLMYNVFLHI